VGLENDQYSAHVRLWGAVIKLAIRDARRLREVGGRTELPEWEYKKYGRILSEASPQEFFESDWFRQICYMSGANPDAIRAAICRVELEEMIDD
tara:strand:+ start:3366 stop:3647 length:282 start_codon:yes stop_codon:yes gene_type:complete